MAKPMTTKDKIREWISDNLRYMLLIGAILLIVAAVLLIVHLVSPKNDGKSSGGTVTSSSTGNNVPDKKTQVKADSKADNAWYLTDGTKTIVSGWLIESLRVHYFYMPMEYCVSVDDLGIEHYS